MYFFWRYLVHLQDFAPGKLGYCNDGIRSFRGPSIPKPARKAQLVWIPLWCRRITHVVKRDYRGYAKTEWSGVTRRVEEIERLAGDCSAQRHIRPDQVVPAT